jgi:hypothetical protein
MIPDNIDNSSPEPEWNFQNTLESQHFNKDGFYQPGKNIEDIQGGIPDSLKAAISGKCNNENLMSCIVPKYSGVLENGQVAPIDGNVHNVYSDPSIVYGLRKMESPEGLVYI